MGAALSRAGWYVKVKLRLDDGGAEEVRHHGAEPDQFVPANLAILLPIEQLLLNFKFKISNQC